MSWLRRLLGIKTDEEIAVGVTQEPTVQNAQRALARVKKWTGVTEDILDDYQAAEAKRRAR